MIRSLILLSALAGALFAPPAAVEALESYPDRTGKAGSSVSGEEARAS